jgi:hypothetical protein
MEAKVCKVDQSDKKQMKTGYRKPLYQVLALAEDPILKRRGGLASWTPSHPLRQESSGAPGHNQENPVVVVRLLPLRVKIKEFHGTKLEKPPCFPCALSAFLCKWLQINLLCGPQF